MLQRIIAEKALRLDHNTVLTLSEETDTLITVQPDQRSKGGPKINNFFVLRVISSFATPKALVNVR